MDWTRFIAGLVHFCKLSCHFQGQPIQSYDWVLQDFVMILLPFVTPILTSNVHLQFVCDRFWICPILFFDWVPEDFMMILIPVLKLVLMFIKEIQSTRFFTLNLKEYIITIRKANFMSIGTAMFLSLANLCFSLKIFRSVNCILID